MSENKRVMELDPKSFEMTDYDNVRIVLPAKPSLSAEDIDAQLFEYVLSGGKKIQSIADLDDSWVKENFEGMETLEEVKEGIKAQYDHEVEFEYSDIKFKACAEALIDRLKGEVPEDTLAHNIDITREGNLQKLDEMHISMEQYLREEHLTPDQYEKKLRDDVLYQMKLNVALDLMAVVLGTQVGNHEITEYLSAPDPEKFLEEIREKDMVEEARTAAVRVKVMRRVVDTAIVETEGEEPAPVQPEPEEEEDIQIPDFENMPDPQISGTEIFTFEKIEPSEN